MKLNWLEFMVMNSPIRALLQERYEVRILRSMTSSPPSGKALEVGCGNGTGAGLIQKYFAPSRIVGIDLDCRMLDIAVRKKRGASSSFVLMDASKLGFPDGCFDSIFDFGIIHHIPNWKDALREVRRVLRAGGELIVEDLSLASFSSGIGWLWRILSAHPYQGMYSPQEFTAFLSETGFTITSYRETHPLGLVKLFWLIASAA